MASRGPLRHRGQEARDGQEEAAEALGRGQGMSGRRRGLVDPDAALAPGDPEQTSVVQAFQRVGGRLRLAAPGVDHALATVVLLERAGVGVPEAGHGDQHLPLEAGQGPRAARVQELPHRPVKKSVGVKDVFLDVQRGVAALEVSGAVARHPVTQDQVLGPGRRTDRVGLDEPESAQGARQGRGREQRVEDGPDAEARHPRVASGAFEKIHAGTMLARGWPISDSLDRADDTSGDERPLAGQIDLHGFSSRNALSRSIAASHCAEISSRQRCAFSSDFGSSCQIRSRPRRLSLTTPASASARRCLVIACRVTSAPSLNREIESGPREQRRATSSRRVGLPSAAKTGVASAKLDAAPLRGRDMAFDVLGLFGPSPFVHPERLVAAAGRDPIEAGLGDRQLGAVSGALERELHERRRLLRVVDLRIDGVRMPAIGEVALTTDVKPRSCISRTPRTRLSQRQRVGGTFEADQASITAKVRREVRSRFRA